ncbi:hypothetical protein EV368DRAFT_61431 [Lentinula lateritia]|uniref:Uncharacterized protein n=1 Tax=Lentinula aff. lateritia TaxID=2804960 RepID=A0ACC1TTA9_9AGAR|nr:hypothetical protein F5876DRAFT_67749 [Lentinula aff. lateritia]KAJ3856752.1 hypothetical protein EV368DRAFT_61431 [Lentinula lateritia]
MHFRPLYLLIGLLTVIHAAPFPATDGANNDGNFTSKDLNIRTEPLSSRIFVTVTVTRTGTCNKTHPIPEVIKARIVAHLNSLVDEFIQSPTTAAQIKFEPSSWNNAADPATTAFGFTWWRAKGLMMKHYVHLNYGEWGVMENPLPYSTS